MLAQPDKPPTKIPTNNAVFMQLLFLLLGLRLCHRSISDSLAFPSLH